MTLSLRRSWCAGALGPKGARVGVTFVPILLASLVPSTLLAKPTVVPVPFVQHDPTVPHPAYNGHPTTFKAISRGAGGCEAPKYRWDIDGNGTWDTCETTDSLAQDANGWMTAKSRYNLECRAQLDPVDPAENPKKLFIATIQVLCPGANEETESAFGSYYVMVFADVPPGRPARTVAPTTYAFSARPMLANSTCNVGAGKCAADSRFPCTKDAECLGDTDETLAIKRQVAVNDGLWYLHKQLSRSGTAETVSIKAYVPNKSATEEYQVASTSAFLWGLSQNGHLAAYPPGTYVHGNGSDVLPLPADWHEDNDFRYNNDPYAEDAARLLNYIVGCSYSSYTPRSGVEGDDGRTPIPGTNNSSSVFKNTNYVASHILGALSTSGMAYTTCQVGTTCNNRTIRWMCQEIVDAICHTQNYAGKSPLYNVYQPGGFPYSIASGDGNSYATLTMWTTIALEAADIAMSEHGVIVNKQCKYTLAEHLYNNPKVSADVSLDGSGRYITEHTSYDGKSPHYTGGLVAGHGWLKVHELPNTDAKSFSTQSSRTNKQLRTRLNSALKFLAWRWHDNSGTHRAWQGMNWDSPMARYDGLQMGNPYAHYSMQKGFRALEGYGEVLKDLAGNDLLPGYYPTAGPFPDTDRIQWFRDYSMYYINNQEVGGGTNQKWTNRTNLTSYVNMNHLTAWGQVLVVTETLFDPAPVAVGTAQPMVVLEGCVGAASGRVTFNHQNSYHLSANRHVAEYQWLFDVDDPENPDFGVVDWSTIPDGGYGLDGKAYRTTIRDATPVYQYLHEGTYHAALRVVDSNPSPKTNVVAISGIRVTRQEAIAPTANAGGPYVITEGDALNLLGQMSDANIRCNVDGRQEVLTARWYLNGDAVADSNQVAGSVSWNTLAGLNLPRNQPFDVRLVVTDSTARTAESKAQVTIYDRYAQPCFAMLPPEKVGCGEEIFVDASCTIHRDPRRTINLVEWQWSGAPYAGEAPAGFPFTRNAVGVEQSHMYAQIGTFLVTMRATDDRGNQVITQQQIEMQARSGPRSVPGGPYVVDTWLDGAQRLGTDLVLDGGESTDSDIACGDRLVSYAWDLDGDGTFGDAVGEQPTLSWTQLAALLAAKDIGPDRFLANPLTGLPRLPIALRVEDSTGRKHEALTSLTIYHNGPYARFSQLPPRAACNQEVVLDASASTHGHPLRTINRYEWDFDVPLVADPGATAAAIAAAFEVQGQGKVVKHRYERFGTYHPVLRVWDDQGKLDLHYGPIVQVSEGNNPPQVSAGGPYVIQDGANLRLDASGTVEPDAACGDSLVSWEWDLDGDGAYDDATGERPWVQWAELAQILVGGVDYPASPHTGQPSVPVRVKVTDSLGGTAVGATSLTVYDRRPVAVAHWAPQPAVPINVNNRAIVRLDGSASYHGHPDGHIVSWSWQVEGSAASIQGETAQLDVNLLPLPNPFPAGGVTRKITLRVSDTAGLSSTAEIIVRFDRLPSQPPQIVFDVPRSGFYIQQGEGFSLSAAATTDPDGDWLNRVGWDLDGDGTDDRVWVRGPGENQASDALPHLMLDFDWDDLEAYGDLQEPGSHPIRLTVSDATGTVAMDTAILHVLEHALVARAAVVPGSGGCQTVFTFDGSQSRHLFPDREIVYWLWDFGDGESDAGEVVDHAYGRFDLFDVTLQVFDLEDRIAETTLQVSTRGGNRPPLVRPGGPYFADEVEKDGVVFDASLSTEPDVACGDRLVTYRWDLDGVLDGQGQRSWEIVTGQPRVELSWQQIEGLPRNNVNHPIVLEIEDSLGGKAQASTTLLVANGAPVASFIVAPESSACGQPVSFDASGSYHPIQGQSIVSYEWDFDAVEGAPFEPSPLHVDELEFAHLFDRMGENRVALRVTDGAGRFSLFYKQVSVSGDNLPPIARTRGDVAGAWGETLVLDGSSSMDPNQICGDKIKKWEWDLDNDGVYELQSVTPVLEVPWNQVSGYGFDLADPFTREESYPIRLRVRDLLDEAGVLVTRLRLYDASPVAKPVVQPAVAACGTEMVFDGRGSYHGHPARQLVRYTWDFDPMVDADADGDFTNDEDEVGALISHEYARMAYDLQGGVVVPKPYLAYLTVTDERELTHTASVAATLSFENYAPTASAGGPYTTTVLNDQPLPVNLDGSSSRDTNEPCDAIVFYAWDTDNDGLFGEDDTNGSVLCGAKDCASVSPTITGLVDTGWRVGMSKRVALRVKDSYGKWSLPAESWINVSDRVPPTVVLDSPNGGEVLRGDAYLRLRVSHPLGKQVRLEVYANTQQIAFVGGDTVMPPSTGALLEVNRLFDSRALPDARDTYRLKVVARLVPEAGGALEDQPFSLVFSRAPFSVDNTLPVITLPDDQLAPVLEQQDAAGTLFAFTPAASDNLDPKPTLKVQPLLEKYPLGTTPVTFTAKDWAGNEATRVVSVVVEDGQAPQLLPGPDVTREALSPLGTEVRLTPSAWDICDASVSLTSDAPAEGFPVGTTTVHFVARDASGNQAEGSLDVIVTDTTAPRLTLPSPPRRNVSQTVARGVPIAGVQVPLPVLSDNGTPTAELSCRIFATLRDPQGAELAPPDEGYPCQAVLPAEGFFPRGETRLTYVVKDAAGNSAQGVYTINVVDVSAPVVTVSEQPESGVWLTEPAVVRFTVADASDTPPGVVVAPLPAGMVDQPQPDAQGVYELVYTQDGTYDVRIFVSDAEGNNSVVVLDRFGLDRTSPVLELTGLPTAGVDPTLPETWPLYFRGETIAPRHSATDLLSGLKRVRAEIVPGTLTGQAVELFLEEPAASGTPLTGPRFLGDLACQDQDGLCLDGELELFQMAAGAQKLVLTAADVVDNETRLETTFRIVELRDALLFVRNRLANLLEEPGQPANVLNALRPIDLLLATAQRSLGAGYLGGCLLSIEIAIKKMTDEGLVALFPVLVEDARLLARGAYSDTWLYRQQAGGNGNDGQMASEFLVQAREHIWTKQQYGGAVLAAENAYFYARNGAAPLRATDVQESIDVLHLLNVELRDYAQHPDLLPAADLVESVRRRLYDEVLWKLENLQEIGYLPAQHFIDMLLLLQDLAADLADAAVQQAWVRNWQWGIGQLIRVVIDLAKADASAILGEAHCKIVEANREYDKGMTWLDDREVDLMLDLYAEHDIRCLMLQIYHDAGYRPAYPPEDFGCVVTVCPEK